MKVHISRTIIFTWNVNPGSGRGLVVGGECIFDVSVTLIPCSFKTDTTDATNEHTGPYPLHGVSMSHRPLRDLFLWRATKLTPSHLSWPHQFRFLTEMRTFLKRVVWPGGLDEKEMEHLLAVFTGSGWSNAYKTASWNLGPGAHDDKKWSPQNRKSGERTRSLETVRIWLAPVWWFCKARDTWEVLVLGFCMQFLLETLWLR